MMTYIEAESIKQDFIVSMQFADIAGKKREEAYTDTAKKYTKEKLAEALSVLTKHLNKEKDFITALFALAIKSKVGK